MAFLLYRKLLYCKVKKRSTRMRTAAYKVDVAGARMCQGTFFVTRVVIIISLVTKRLVSCRIEEKR